MPRRSLAPALNRDARRRSRGGAPLVAILFAMLLTMSPLARAVSAADPVAPSISPDATLAPAPSVDPSPPSDPPTATPSPSPSDDRTGPASTTAPVAAGAKVAAPTPDAPSATAAATTTWFTSLSPSGTKGVQAGYGFAVSPVPDGGTVSLKVDGTVVDSATPDPGWGGGGVFWTPATIGTHHLQLVFSGTAAFAGSSSIVNDVEIYNPPPTSVDITTPSLTVARATDTTFTVTVTPNPGSGSVEWYLESGLAATVALDGTGKAEFTTSFATTGQHGVLAKFTGNASWSWRASDWFHVTVVGDTVALALSVPSNPAPAGDVVLTATVTPNPGGGSVRFAWGIAGFTVVPLDVNGQATLDLGTLTASYYGLDAEFQGTEIYGLATGHLDLFVWNVKTVALATNRTTATVGELPVILTATVTAPTGLPNEQVSWVDTVAGVDVTLGPVAVNPYTGVAAFSTSSLRVGVHSIKAHYQPGTNAYTFDADSAPVAVTVVADKAVHVTFAPSLTTFYAYKDGFRDTTSLGGVLDERATVTIKIYSSTGSLKRTFNLGWKLAGKYSAAWNGRTATGTAVAAGKYKVVASFKDARANTRSITAYTTVSWRRATWKSVTVLKYADAGTYYVDGGGAIYYSNDYSHGRILDSGSMIRDCTGCGWAAGRIGFSVVSTSVLDYRSIYLEVRGHGFSDREHTGSTSIENPVTHAYATEVGNCEFDVADQVCGQAVSKSLISSTHHITAWVWMTQAWGDAYDLKYLKLTYQYAVWAS
jgi:hypothetical protein